MTDPILDRVRKLLRLAERNTNPNEAAAAAAAAQRLITQHGLEAAALAAETGEALDGEAVSDAHEPLERGKRKVHWHGWLANAVGRANGCMVIWRGSTLRIIGRPSDVAVASWLYTYVRDEIERLARVALASPANAWQVKAAGARVWGNSFRVGAVKAVEAALKRAREEAERPYAGTQALVLVRERAAEVQTWVDANLTVRGKAQSQARTHHGAIEQGYEAGKRIDLSRRPVGGGAATALLGGRS